MTEQQKIDIKQVVETIEMSIAEASNPGIRSDAEYENILQCEFNRILEAVNVLKGLLN